MIVIFWAGCWSDGRLLIALKGKSRVSCESAAGQQQGATSCSCGQTAGQLWFSSEPPTDLLLAYCCPAEGQLMVSCDPAAAKLLLNYSKLRSTPASCLLSRGQLLASCRPDTGQLKASCWTASYLSTWMWSVVPALFMVSMISLEDCNQAFSIVTVHTAQHMWQIMIKHPTF
jgi:hypothetical protein